MGQRLRSGSIGVWNQVSPYLGGIGVTSLISSCFICLYYNMIVAWCFYYLFISFQDPLPFESCPTVTGSNVTEPECAVAGETSYYWYRKALNLSPSISEAGEVQWHLALVLLLAWLIVFLCTMKGVKSTGKVNVELHSMCKFFEVVMCRSINQYTRLISNWEQLRENHQLCPRTYAWCWSTFPQLFPNCSRVEF